MLIVVLCQWVAPIRRMTAARKIASDSERLNDRLALHAARRSNRKPEMKCCCSLFFLIALLAYPAQARSSHLEKVLATGEVSVCIWPDYYGISFRNPQTRQLNGIDIDMAHALARDLGVRVRFVDSSFASLIEDVTVDRCDIAMFAIGVTPLRSEKLRFTQPYLASDIYAVTTRSNRRIRTWDDIDQAGVVVAVAKGTLHEPVMREKLKQATLLVTATTQGREQEVESGRADVFMTDFPFSRRMLETTDWARLVVPSKTYYVTPYAYAVQKGDDLWYARIERFLRDVKRDGQLLAAIKRHKLGPIAVSD